MLKALRSVLILNEDLVVNSRNRRTSLFRCRAGSDLAGFNTPPPLSYSMNECVVDKEHSGWGPPLSTFPICSHARILPLNIFLAGVWIPSAFVRADAFSLTQIGGGVIF